LHLKGPDTKRCGFAKPQKLTTLLCYTKKIIWGILNLNFTYTLQASEIYFTSCEKGIISIPSL